MTDELADMEVDRMLRHLRDVMRQHNWSQLDVQRELGWGRSYISQLMTRQKMLRVEQVLMILDVMGVDPATFYYDFYRHHSRQTG